MWVIRELLLGAAIVLFWVVVCAIGGGLIAWGVCIVFPEYYPAVFSASRGTEEELPRSNAYSLGVATGVVQGAGAGVLVGSALVVSIAILRARRTKGGTAAA